MIDYASVIYMKVIFDLHKHMTAINSSQVLQNKCLRIILNAPRRTAIEDLHRTVDIERLQAYLLHISARFYDQCSAHINPLVANIGRYEKSDLHIVYKRYMHKRPKHVLL
jgi:hypothetical protein